MKHKLSRRGFFWTAGGMLAAGRGLLCDQKVVNQSAPDSKMGHTSLVSLVQGTSRRKNVCQSLLAIEHQILPQLRQKKYVVIKPNIVSTVNPLAATHVDALHGILDFLAPRFKGPVVIAESAAGFTPEGFDNFRYHEVISEHKPLQVSLVDLNEEARYEAIPILNADLHATPVRLAARLLDPEAYTICSAILKTHNVVVATLSIKNMTLGAPLHNSRKETKRWNDKRLYHGGVRQTHYDIFLTAQKMTPFWGATVIDGFEGMEGNGPASGFPVASRIALASTDFVAADRVAIEAMGIDSSWVGYLSYCGQFGLGQHDLTRIDVQGARVSDVAKKYQLHQDIERELQWMGPMTDLPPKLG
jgi:uncharacterized protein (DUF362 family)